MTVNVTRNPLICLHNLLDFMIDEEIEGIDVLLDQALDLEECRQEVPFVLAMG